MNTGNTINEATNPACFLGVVSGSSSVKKFRRGKKFQQAYFDIGMTNQSIQNLLIEAKTFEKYGNKDEADMRRDLAEKWQKELSNKYNSEEFDLKYIIPQTSGLYVVQKMRDVL